MAERFTFLFERYLSETISAPERAEFWQLIKGGAHDALLLELIDRHYQNFDSDVSPFTVQTEQRMLENIVAAREDLSVSPQKKTFTLWKRWSAAAAVLLVLATGGYFYYQSKLNGVVETAFQNDVAPGKEGATLTLADGRMIRLADAANGTLAEEAGVKIYKTADGQLTYEIRDISDENRINTISTSNGETYKVRLPDGSTVWLNAASSLTYKANLIEGYRRVVKLSGEGYFEVAKDRVHPFVVESGGQQVEVLGTQFNVNSYVDEPSVATTLVEGSVKVLFSGREKVLRPGEQAQGSRLGISVSKVDLDEVVDWKDGDFNLQGMDLEASLRKIARWYDVEVVYEDPSVRDVEIGGWISRSRKLSAVLEHMAKSGQVSFRIVGRKIYVSK